VLLRLLDFRRTSKKKTHRFRWRGDGVSRIEGLSDTVFGFAITLVAVSLEVPRTADALLHNALGFIPFVVSFLVLFFLWRAQFEFFRRYGLEDEPTQWLTGMLLVFVLFLIYPLKFLLTVFSDAILAGDVARDRLRLAQLPAVLALYASGFLGVFLALALLYRHAFSKRHALALTELEQFDTSGMQKRWSLAAMSAAAVLAWCAALMAAPAHLKARDNTFNLLFYGGGAAVFLLSLSQRVLRRRLRHERDALIARVGADDAPPPVVLLD
jgi:uncharacterized membrane protein